MRMGCWGGEKREGRTVGVSTEDGIEAWVGRAAKEQVGEKGKFLAGPHFHMPEVIFFNRYVVFYLTIIQYLKKDQDFSNLK